MAKKITGVIMIIIGLLPFVLPIIHGFLGGGNGRAGHAAGPAQHLGALGSAFATIGPLLIIVPIVFIIVWIILLTHKEKAVKE